MLLLAQQDLGPVFLPLSLPLTETLPLKLHPARGRGGRIDTRADSAPPSTPLPFRRRIRRGSSSCGSTAEPACTRNGSRIVEISCRQRQRMSSGCFSPPLLPFHVDTPDLPHRLQMRQMGMNGLFWSLAPRFPARIVARVNCVLPTRLALVIHRLPRLPWSPRRLALPSAELQKFQVRFYSGKSRVRGARSTQLRHSRHARTYLLGFTAPLQRLFKTISREPKGIA